MSFFHGSVYSGGRDFSAVKSVTEKYGYQPTRVLIENAILSGKRLRAFNAGQYMYSADSFNNFTVADDAAITMPIYADKLTLIEKRAYIDGVRSAYIQSIKGKAEDDAAKKAADEKFANISKAFEVIAAQSKDSQASEPDTKPE